MQTVAAKGIYVEIGCVNLSAIDLYKVTSGGAYRMEDLQA
jgi:hypothetical protein